MGKIRKLQCLYLVSYAVMRRLDYQEFLASWWNTGCVCETEKRYFDKLSVW